MLAGFPIHGTAAGIVAYAMTLCPAVKRVTVTSPTAGRVVVTIRLRWFTWFSLGLLHWVSRRLMRRTEGDWLPAGAVAEVRVR